MYPTDSARIISRIVRYRTVFTLVLATVATLFSVPCSQAVDLPDKAGAGQRLKTIIVDNYNPYTFLNDKGEPDGFSVEIAKAVAKTMDLELEIRVGKWDRAVKELETGSIDLLPMMAYSEERDRLFDFSVLHTIAYDAIFFKKGNSGLRSLNDLSGKTVIVMNKDVAHSYLLSSGLSKTMSLNLVDSLPEALKQLAAGKGDAAIMPKLVGIATAKKLNLSDIETSPQLIDGYTRPFCFAVKDGNQALLERLNQGLNIIKSTGQYDAIYKKWFGTLEEPPLNIKTVTKYGAVAVLVLLGFVAWNIILKRQVMSKTKHLEAEIVQRKLSEAALRESKERFKSILENAPIGMAVVSLEGRFTLVNSSLCKIIGYQKEELEKLTFQEITYPDDLESDLANVKRLLNGSIQSYSIEKRYVRKDDQIVWIHLTTSLVSDAAGTPQYLIAQIKDITNRKLVENAIVEFNQKLEALSTTDSLTGIANRRRFDEFLAQEYARHARSKGKLSLILLDIDQFKLFNDHYGHVKGDECLRQIARVLDDCTIRPADLVARYGGEEFACILPETDLRGALLVAERIRQDIINLAIPHEWSNVAECVSASLGVVTISCSAGEAVSDIVVQADQLLYRAKSLGRNRVECKEMGQMPEQSDTNFVYLAWQDDFCSGNQLIDAQHKLIFRDSNELLEAIFMARSKDVISSITTRLLDDISRHFRDEENILESIGFPDMKSHALEHAKLHKKGLDLAQQFISDTLHAGALFEFLVFEVVNQQILGTDREFFTYTNNTASAGPG